MKRRYILEESEKLPKEIFESAGKVDPGTFTIFKIGGPVDKTSVFGKVYKPEKGWDSLQPSDFSKK
ncbi:MAG: hypothetical protein V3V88_02970 [Dehalococcoidia bacterium]